ncbi:MAG: hypothetical protein IH623_19740 [Verrucomicrobia bacterium]|nr:hypothetical protein [Verrucomicrobiota bacterium]
MKNVKSVLGWIGLVVLWSAVLWSVAFGRGQAAGRFENEAAGSLIQESLAEYDAKLTAELNSIERLEADLKAVRDDLRRVSKMMVYMSELNHEQSGLAKVLSESLAGLGSRVAALEKRPVAVVRQPPR